jgi:response regulator RpfG family c-di-GMP phosphodiesterase
MLHAAPYFAEEAPRPVPYNGWQARPLAARMLHPHGVHRFCCTLRFYPAKRRFAVEYSYCELFFTRLVNSWMARRMTLRDHRAFFTAAPRAVILILLLALLVSVLYSFFPVAGVIAFTIFSAILAVAAGIFIYTIGSIQYTREHHDQLIQSYYDTITTLSRFPQANPNPVLKIRRDGVIVYQNPGAYAFMKRLGLDTDDFSHLLPPSCREIVSDMLSRPGGVRTLDVRTHDRELHFTITPFPDEKAVIFAGTDVTLLKQVEKELRELNRDLEDRVRERTEELMRTQQATIISLGSLAETRDPETGAHIQRTSTYVRALADALADHPAWRDFLTPRTIEELTRSVPLHDIGKVAIPDHILKKHGKLTPEEYEIMKKHTVFGAEALRRAEQQLGENSFLHLAREVACYHHERWDGTGYPGGLAGEAIPRAARLMALADVYDALTTERVYKEAWPHARARALILENRGKIFDPDVIDTFVQLEDRFQEIRRELADDAPGQSGSQADVIENLAMKELS